MASVDSRVSRENTVTQDYLKAIWGAEENGDEGITIRALASRVGVAVSTASEKVKRLAAEGLAFHEPYGKVTLTGEGRRRALEVVRRHRLLETYLHDALGFDWDEVHEEAEILEHAVSDRLLNRIDEQLGYPRRDPHGDPIPSADGQVCILSLTPLRDIPLHRRMRIARFSDSDARALRSLEAKGLGLDAVVAISERMDAQTMKVIVQAEEKERLLELNAQEVALVFVASVEEQEANY